MNTAIVAIGAAISGATAQLAASPAVADAASSGSDVAPWLQGGGSAAAVAGLVYVARMIVKGDLVPRAVADRENETAAAIRVQAQQVVELRELVNEAHAREVVAANVTNESVRALADVSAELRWWRDQRERGRTVTLPQGEGGPT